MIPSPAHIRPARFAAVWLAVLLLASLAAAADQVVTIPDQDTPVVDAAGVLDADARRQLVDLLHELKEKTGDQIKVLTVPNLAGEDIFAFAQRHYDLWKLGSKKESKGALIVLAPADRKVRIHTGYGLEGALPDSWCGTAERAVAQKYFARREYAKGLVELTQAVVRRVAADAGVELNGLPAAPPPGAHASFDPTLIIIAVLVLIYLFNLYRQWRGGGPTSRWRRTSPGWGWSTFPSGGWTGGGDWSSGGGGGGGGWSSGGSDFGGGGSSGGGGASASW